MAFAISLTILASFLWAITNHMDKFLVAGDEKSPNGIRTLLVFSTLVAGVIISPIWLIASKFSIGISWLSLACIAGGAIFSILGVYLYFKALEKNDASIIVVMFQLIPVFSYILALIFFKENLTTKQLIGSVVIILSAVFISLEFGEKNKKGKWAALALMALSSLCYSTYYIFFDFGIRHSPYKSCAFWFQIMYLIIGLILFCNKSFRNEFVSAIRNNGKRYITLNLSNEALNLIAMMLVNFANVTIPLAIANVCNGFQAAFVFILGVLGVTFFPKYFKEDLRKKVVFKKVGCIILGIAGLAIMFI